jgi:hypothetical protein
VYEPKDTRAVDQPIPPSALESPNEQSTKTDADGRFRADQVPVGTATVWLRKSGYCRPGLGQPIKTPANDVELRSRARITFPILAKSGDWVAGVSSSRPRRSRLGPGSRRRDPSHPLETIEQLILARLLTMMKAARIVVTVDFAGADRPHMPPCRSLFAPQTRPQNVWTGRVTPVNDSSQPSRKSTGAHTSS